MKTKQNGCFIFKSAKTRNGAVLELFFKKRGRFDNYFEKKGSFGYSPKMKRWMIRVGKGEKSLIKRKVFESGYMNQLWFCGNGMNLKNRRMEKTVGETSLPDDRMWARQIIGIVKRIGKWNILLPRKVCHVKGDLYNYQFERRVFDPYNVWLGAMTLCFKIIFAAAGWLMQRVCYCSREIVPLWIVVYSMAECNDLKRMFPWKCPLGCDNFINPKFDRMSRLFLRMFLERASVLWQICWVVECLLRQTKSEFSGRSCSNDSV